MKTQNRTVLDTVQIIQSIEANRQVFEVCATALASYSEDRGELAVTLDCFVRRFEMQGKDVEFRPGWLPKCDSVKMKVDLEEAPDAAKSIFGSWAKKVRATIPPSSEWTANATWLRSIPAARPIEA